MTPGCLRAIIAARAKKHASAQKTGEQHLRSPKFLNEVLGYKTVQTSAAKIATEFAYATLYENFLILLLSAQVPRLRPRAHLLSRHC